MSAPHQNTPSSPTPSKSSLRKPSGIQNPSSRNLIPSPSPRFEDQPTTQVRYSPRSPPNQTLEYNSDDDDDAYSEDEGPDSRIVPRDESYFPPPPPHELMQPFRPLFTLIEDPSTSEHYHPSVHYIFADDDQEIITEAAVRSLEENDEDDLEDSSITAHRQGIGSAVHPESRTEAEDGQDLDTAPILPPAQPGVREHYLVLDVQPAIRLQPPSQSQLQSPLPFGSASQIQIQNQTQTQPQSAGDDSHSRPTSQPQPSGSFSVSKFASLSSDWQITSATVTSAPTMSDNPTAEEEGLMLRIEGQSIAPLSASDFNIDQRQKRTSVELTAAAAAVLAHGETIASEADNDKLVKTRENLDNLIERFQSRLSEIRKLLDVEVPFVSTAIPVSSGVLQTEGGEPQADFELGAAIPRTAQRGDLIPEQAYGHDPRRHHEGSESTRSRDARYFEEQD